MEILDSIADNLSVTFLPMMLLLRIKGVDYFVSMESSTVPWLVWLRYSFIATSLPTGLLLKAQEYMDEQERPEKYSQLSKHWAVGRHGMHSVCRVS